MIIKNLRLSNFRNYVELKMDFSNEGAVFEGLNGSGKTNILESIYLLCTGKSQRNAKRSNMIRIGSEYSYVEGGFESDDTITTTASFGFDTHKKVVMRINNIQINSYADWFGKRPIVSFGVDDLTIITGSPDLRRKFVDNIFSQIDSEYLTNLLNYNYYLKSRNLLFTKTYDDLQCDIYDQKLAETGAYLILKRQELIEELNEYFSSFYNEISNNKESSKMIYKQSFNIEYCRKNECKNVFYSMLKERRNKDYELGFTSIGPHRDDITFLLNDKPLKNYGSQGQCRSNALSLKLGSVLCIEKYRKEKMIFLIDDAVSELDMERTSNVIPLIEKKGQIFIAIPDFKNIKINKNLLRYRVSEGNVLSQ